MKCTSKKNIIVLCIVFLLLLTGCSSTPVTLTEYEKNTYNRSIYQGALFASDLCVTDTDISLEGFTSNENLHAAGLFDLKNEKVLYADRLFERIYPASTTKVLTAYLTLKYGNLDDVVTVGANATGFAADEQVCGLQEGDRVTLYDLLCGLVLHSGNDNAVAIAEHLSGSVEAFSDLMNTEARAMGATGTHFTNPHGLHEDNHYTTAYDLYLMFNNCVKDQRFLDIISMDSYVASLTGADGNVRTAEWLPSNYYSQGVTAPPDGVDVFGGKTGTTDQAGACVILYSQDIEATPYISVVMGADGKDILYDDMSALMSAGEKTTAE